MGGNPLLSQPWRLRLAVSRADDFRFTSNIGYALAMSVFDRFISDIGWNPDVAFSAC